MQNEDNVYDLVDQITFGSLIFIDEVHSIPKSSSEALYNLLEYQKFEGKTVPKHTMIGCTTEAGTLQEAFRERFQIEIELMPLNEPAMFKVVNDHAKGVKVAGYI